jgi:hypothetical protein
MCRRARWTRSALRHARCSCPGAMARMALSERCQRKRAIALTAERYAKYNTIGAEVEDSRPFLPNQCLMGACRMTPTIRQSSARVARPRLLELSRQVAVDFQPDADFDERRRCPGHGFLPFMGQYLSRLSAYPGKRRIQEIRIIAFVYGPARGSPANPPPRPAWTHALPRDDATRLAADLREGSFRSFANRAWETSRRQKGTPGPHNGPVCSITSINCQNAPKPS